MKDEMKIISKEEILRQGINFDDELWSTSYSDEVLDNPENEEGKPFTGLAYELYDNGNLAYYCYYKNGFKDGDYVKFHNNGKIKSIDYMVKGQTRDIRKKWYETEELMYEGEFMYGVCLRYTEWDKQGNIIRQKVSPTQDDLKLIARLSDSDHNDQI